MYFQPVYLLNVFSLSNVQTYKYLICIFNKYKRDAFLKHVCRPKYWYYVDVSILLLDEVYVHCSMPVHYSELLKIFCTKNKCNSYDANCYYIFDFELMLSCNGGESHFHNGRLEMDFGWNEIFNVPAAPFHTVNLSNVLPNEKFYRLFLFKVSNLATTQNIFKSKITWK